MRINNFCGIFIVYFGILAVQGEKYFWNLKNKSKIAKKTIIILKIDYSQKCMTFFIQGVWSL